MEELRRSSSVVTETLPAAKLESMIDGLFPDIHGNPYPSPETVSFVEDVDLSISVEETFASFKSKKSRITAPGPDGVCGCIWRKSTRCAMTLIARLFEKYLRTSTFLHIWKRALLVLIPKPSTNGGPLKCRPICLLDDISKAFERIIARKIHKFLNTQPNGGIARA